MPTTQPYTLLTTAYLTLQTLPLLLTPTLLLPSFTPTTTTLPPYRPTATEIYLSRALGLALLTLALTILPLTGILPVKSLSTSTDAGAGDTGATPYAFPTIVTTTAYHAFSAFYLYAQLTGRPVLFTLGMVMSAGLACLGLWTVMFGMEDGGRVKGGVDKRTGNFPFVNAESAKEKKRRSKSLKGRE